MAQALSFWGTPLTTFTLSDQLVLNRLVWPDVVGQ